MKDTIAFYPDIGRVAIKENLVPKLRSWLAFHAWTTTSGFVSVEDVYDTFTTKHSPYYICGKKRMKTILREGEGLFWVSVRDGKILRLAGKNTLAERLDLDYLTFRSVKLETRYLFKSLKHTKAALLDAFYGTFDRPIARTTLESLLGISVSTQKELEKLIGIRVQDNYLRVEKEEDKQEAAWRHGNRIVARYDNTGKVTGEKGKLYFVKKLANTYINKQDLAGTGARKEYNKSKNASQHTTIRLGKRERLYSTPESRSNKAKYEMQTTVFGQTNRSKTKLGRVGIWVETWR